MHKNERWASRNKTAVMLLALVLLLTAVFGSTLGYVVTRTPSILNTFFSGLEPTGDLTIEKIVEHPFGDNYQIPDDVKFIFAVELGADYAGKTVETSQGLLTADETGGLEVTIGAGKAVVLRDIKEGTSVTVTEQLIRGFTVKDGAEKTVVIEREANEISFTNTYTPAKVDPINLSVTGTKVLEGREWQEGDVFTFLLEYKQFGSVDDWKELGTATVMYEQMEVQDPEDPTRTILVDKPNFDQFDLTELVQSVTYDLAGTYCFRISEQKGSIGGISYDTGVSYFDVYVGDADMDGSLEIQKVKGYENADVLPEDGSGTHRIHVTVSNRYVAAGETSVTIQIDKVVSSNSGEKRSKEGFTFELYNVQGNLLATSAATSAAGEAAFKLDYDAEDVGKTFHYVVKETHAGDTINGMSYDERSYELSVTVIDNLDGTIGAYIYETAEPESATDCYSITFTNTYDPKDTQITIQGSKELTGRDMAVGEFAFLLYETDDTFDVPEGARPIGRTTNGEDDVFVFESLPFDRVGTYRYVVMEDASWKLGGIDYDDTQFCVTVTVSDTGGQLQANMAITDELGESAALQFHNHYSASKAIVILEGRKKLTGDAMNEAASFRFLLYATTDTFAVPEGAEPIEVIAAGEGDFAFAELTYETEGENYYVIVEDDQYRTIEGMTYDDTLYGIKVSIADNGVGQLVPTVEYHADGEEVDDVIFENVYAKPEETTPEETTPEETTPEETTPEETTPEETSPEETTPEETSPQETETTKVEQKPQKPSEPGDTGDDSNIALLAWLMIVSLIVVISLLVRGRGRREDLVHGGR